MAIEGEPTYEDISQENIFVELEKRKAWIDNPDDFSVMSIQPLKQLIIGFLYGKNKINVTSGRAGYFVESLWMEYDFFFSNIRELCNNLYGSSCCADKARFLVKSAISWQETGKIPELNWEGEYTFHYPKTGTMEQWMAVIEGLFDMLYGYNKKYLEAIENLRLQHIKESIPLNLNREQY